MEIPNFDFFVDREKNKPCLIAGNAPSVINFPFATFKGICIMTSRGPRLLRRFISPHYWISSNHEFPIPQKHLSFINALTSTVLIFSDTATYGTGEQAGNVYDYDFMKNNIKIPWFTFDERHFGRQKCQPPKQCCKLLDIYPQRITLQEYMEKRFGVAGVRKDIGTAILYALMFAIIMGCNPIYIQGVELPLYAKDYVYYSASISQRLENVYFVVSAYLKQWLKKKVHSYFEESLEPTLNHFERLTELCHKRGVEIYNLSPTSSLNKIKSLPYLDYHNVHGQ